MNFKQLETFYWVTKLNGFSAAAKRLNATQSTISVRISELEHSIGVKLFDRRGSQIKLNPSGEELLPFAAEAIALAGRITRSVGRERTFSGRVRLGVGEIVATSWLPSLIGQIKDAYPAIEFELVVDLTVNLYQHLQDGALDLAIGVGRHMAPTITSVSVGSTPMHWVASPSLGLNGEPLTAEDLAERPVFSLPKGSHLHVTLMQWFAANSAVQPTIHTSNSLSTMIALTRHGIGLAVLPRVLIERDLIERTLEVLKVIGPVGDYEFFLTYESSRLKLAPAIEAVLEIAPGASMFTKR